MSPRHKKVPQKARRRSPGAWHLYILETLDGRLYTGITNDVERRMKAHKTGKGAKFTRIFGFKELLYAIKLPTQSQAMKREAEIKRWPKRRKIKLISGGGKEK